MKKLAVLFTLFSLVIVLTSGTNMLTGMAGSTGSPGENTCASCHHGSFSLQLGSIHISSFPAFDNNTYVPNQTYDITVTVKEPGKSVFGFDFEALNNSNTDAGNIIVTDNVRTHLMTSNNRNNITHQHNGGASLDSAKFTFKWTAPSSGDVTLYTAGIASAGNYIQASPFKTSLNLHSSLSSNVEENNLASMAIFPNPAANYVTIKATLPSAQNISAQVFDVEGKLVKDFFNQNMPAGEFSKTLSIEDIPSGIYFIKMLYGNALKTQKLVIQ